MIIIIIKWFGINLLSTRKIKGLHIISIIMSLEVSSNVLKVCLTHLTGISIVISVDTTYIE